MPYSRTVARSLASAAQIHLTQTRWGPSDAWVDCPKCGQRLDAPLWMFPGTRAMSIRLACGYLTRELADHLAEQCAWTNPQTEEVSPYARFKRAHTA